MQNLRFLVATDIHLGYKENHHIRGQDSFKAFQQVLQIAYNQQVDFLLLGGDLFDVVSPTPTCLYKAMTLLQQYVYKRKDQSPLFEVQGMIANFHNPSLQIGLPIFTIHGNHDYPAAQFGSVSVCDLFHKSQFVNYFGKYSGQDILVKPLLFKKGKAKLALYGLGHIKDIRLHKMLILKKIRFQNVGDQYYKILVLHQNAYKGTQPGASHDQCIHNKHLPNWMNLVIWCHQHKSIPQISKANFSQFQLYQPGSTIITKLIEAQQPMKHSGLITIKPDGIDFQPQFLKSSYRPLILQNFELSQLYQTNKKSLQSIQAQQLISNYLQKLLSKYEDQQKQKQSIKKPLIRFKIQLSGYAAIRAKLIQQRFQKRVANPNQIIVTYKRRQRKIPQIDKAISNQVYIESILQKKINSAQDNTLHRIKQIFFNRATQGRIFPLSLISATVFQSRNNHPNQIQTLISQTVTNAIKSSSKSVATTTTPINQNYQTLLHKIKQNSQKIQQKQVHQLMKTHAELLNSLQLLPKRIRQDVQITSKKKYPIHGDIQIIQKIQATQNMLVRNGNERNGNSLQQKFSLVQQYSKVPKKFKQKTL